MEPNQNSPLPSTQVPESLSNRNQIEHKQLRSIDQLSEKYFTGANPKKTNQLQMSVLRYPRLPNHSEHIYNIYQLGKTRN